MVACTSIVNANGRECVKCFEFKSWENYWRDWDGKEGKSARCKSCRKLSRKPEHPDIKRASSYKLNYGITLKEYNSLFEKQEGKCKICSKHASEFKRSLAVDHCHKTGVIRGLLCINCNFGLGKFMDNQELLEKAKNYLKGFQNG